MRPSRFAPLGLLSATLVLAGASWGQPNGAEGECVAALSIAVDHDAGVVTLSWSASMGAASYEVHRSVDGGASAHVATVVAPATMFVDDPAPEGVLEYRVAADGFPSAECLSVSAHIGGTPVPPERPVCVGDVVGVATADGIRLSWPAVPGAVSYDVLRAQGDAALAPYAFVPAGTTEFFDAAVEPGVAYRYVVSANGLPPEGVRCEVAEVTAVPFFGGVVGAAAAAVAAVAAFVVLRRR